MMSLYAPRAAGYEQPVGPFLFFFLFGLRDAEEELVLMLMLIPELYSRSCLRSCLRLR